MIRLFFFFFGFDDDSYSCLSIVVSSFYDVTMKNMPIIKRCLKPDLSVVKDVSSRAEPPPGGGRLLFSYTVKLNYCC